MKKLQVIPQLSQRVISFSEHHNLFYPGEPIVVGFSGGPDSLFLLTTLASWKNPDTIIAAHLDHGWRHESVMEVQFCATITHNLGVRFVSGHLNTYAPLLKQHGSQEDLGRQARRLFFKDVAHTNGAHTIALAHHADDHIENFFVRLIRGAGLQGLAGMQPRNDAFVHPLLEITKKEILSFLNEHAIEYLKDPSNESPVYLRNRIRKEAIPALTTCDPRATINIARALDHLAQADNFCEAQAQKTLEGITTAKDGGLWLDIVALKELHPYLRNRVLIRWLCTAGVPFTPTKSFFDECERFLFMSTKSSQHMIAPSWLLVKQQKHAFCKRLTAA